MLKILSIFVAFLENANFKGKPESVVVKLLPKVRRVDMEKVICPVLWPVDGVENFSEAFVEVAWNGAHIGFK